MPSASNTRAAASPHRPRLTHSATIAFLSILCIAVVGHDLFGTWQDRGLRLEESSREVANLARAAEQFTEDAFHLAGTSLAPLADLVESEGTAQSIAPPAQRERLHHLMALDHDSLPLLFSMAVISETGDLLVGSGPTTAGINVSDRDYFKFHRTHADRGLYVSPVMRSRIAGNPIIAVSRRVDYPDGRFAGVVTASIDVAWFQSFYATLDLRHNGSAGLFLDDGTLLVRRPFMQAAIGSKRSTLPPFTDPLLQQNSGVAEIVSPLDNTKRIYAWRRVANYPLVVGIALGKDEQLAAWRANATEHLLAGLVIAILLGFVGLRHLNQVRLLRRAEREIDEANAIAGTAAAQYRLLADNASDMIVTIGLDFKRTYVSPGSRHLLGYEPEALTGLCAKSLVHPDEAELLSASLRDLAAGRDRERISCRMRHRHGHWVWADVSFRLARDPATGAPVEIQSAMRDVSDRMAALDALEQIEQSYRLLLRNSSGVTEAIYMLDPKGNVETWNAAAERIKGYAAAEIIGQNYAVCFTPEDIAAGEPQWALARALETGRLVTEGWRVRKDGSRFMASMVIDAVRDDNGALRGFAHATHDITNQRIEEAQRAIIIEAAPNGMMIVDEAGIVTLANSQVERIFDYPNGLLIGQPLEILVPEGFRTEHGELRSAFTSGRSDKGMEPQRQFTGRKRDGGPVIIEIMLSPVATPRGRIVVATLFDVTDRLRLAAEREAAEQRDRLATAATNASLESLARHLAKARDRAEQANRAKSRFLAGMSHELRTPLNGILGYAHLLHIEGGLNPAQTGRVDAMMEAGRHLLEMITCVLDLSEIEADHLVLRPASVDVAAIAAACLDLVRPMAEAKGLALGVKMAPDLPSKLMADPTRLRQILLNLLGNAAKFTFQGAIELRVSMLADGSALRIEVVDTGPGISAGQRERLFHEFERLDTEVNRTIEGAGLGLALSARLAALMGGSLGHADNPSGGSVFWLELPLDNVATPVPNPETGGGLPAVEALRPAPCHVLVVDDVLMNRDIAASFLRLAEHTVVCVEGGAEAVAAAASTDFDVILMDVRMPGMDGLEATRRIRQLPGPRGCVPIVALTAQAFTEQVAACRTAGMNSHLSKPFNPDTLLAAVAEAVAAGRSVNAPLARASLLTTVQTTDKA